MPSLPEESPPIVPVSQVTNGQPDRKATSRRVRSRAVLNADFIRTKVTVHDRTQLESVFDYRIMDRNERADQGSKMPPLNYQVDAYLFFPPQMGISPLTYTKERFYQDLHPMIRLCEPPLTDDELSGDSDIRKHSPIMYLQEFMAMATSNENRISMQEAINEGRMFGCSFSSYIMRRIDRRMQVVHQILEQRGQRGNERTMQLLDRSLDSIMQFQHNAHDTLKAWRFLCIEAASMAEGELAQFRREVDLVNEYVTYRFWDGLARVGELLDLVDYTAMESFAPKARRVRRQLQAFVRLERWYAQRAGFMWVDRDSPLSLQERYVYRRGALKRRIWQVLYLDVRTKPTFAFQQQVGAITAAGVAASLYVGAEIMLRSSTSFQGFNNLQSLGTSGLLFITFFVLAYIVKDRIKELGRSYFRSHLLGNIPDNSDRILYKMPDGTSLNFGSIQEFTKFLNADQVPERVMELRDAFNAQRLDEEESGARIIHYSKHISLRQQALAAMPLPITSVHDILRLNVTPFLARLDDPLHPALLVTELGQVDELMMPKVYHLDMVLKYSKILAKRNEQVVYDYIRLVMNKKGLVRVERIS